MIRLFRTVVYHQTKFPQVLFFSTSCRRKIYRIFEPGHLNIIRYAKQNFFKAGNIRICISSSHSKKVEPSVEKYVDKFDNLLDEIDKKENDLTVDDVIHYVNEIHAILENLALEDHHEQVLLKDERFIKLNQTILELIDQIPSNNLISVLRLNSRLHLPADSYFSCEILRNLQSRIKDLNFQNKVMFWTSLWALWRDSENGKDVFEILTSLEKTVLKEIESKIHLQSPDNTVAAFRILTSKYIPNHIKRDILYAVLDLEEWNDHQIFRYFLHRVVGLGLPVDEDLINKFKERIREEVRNKNENLYCFVGGYGKAIEKDVIGLDYEKDLLDEVVSGVVECNPSLQKIHSVLGSLSEIRHNHDGFMKYLIDFLENNQVVFESHPLNSVRIIAYLACCMHDNRDKDELLIKLKNILSNNSSLDETLKFLRNHEQYYYMILNLASIGIFSNKELKYISNYYNVEKNFRDCHKKHKRFLISLNQAVKVLNPSYPEALLNENIVSIGLKIVQGKDKSPLEVKRRETCRHLGMILERVSNIKNCALVQCRNKLTYSFDVIVAVNKKGEFYNFGVMPEDYDEKIVIEDVLVPNDFKLFALTVLSEKQHARNTLTPVGLSSLRLQINEKLGFSNCIVYEKFTKDLTDEELGNYLLDLITGKILKKTGKNT